MHVEGPDAHRFPSFTYRSDGTVRFGRQWGPPPFPSLLPHLVQVCTCPVIHATNVKAAQRFLCPGLTDNDSRLSCGPSEMIVSRRAHGAPFDYGPSRMRSRPSIQGLLLPQVGPNELRQRSRLQNTKEPQWTEEKC